MKRFLGLLVFTAAMFTTHATYAQPTGAPAGTTGLCNDGSYSSAASKAGACRGHQGVKTWYAAAPAKGAAAAATTAAPAAATKPAAPAPAPVVVAKPATPAPAPAAATPAPAVAGAKKGPAAAAEAKTAVPGGAPNLVWVNTSSKVYHCYGSTYYGKTKAGAYMSESDAQAKGNRANDNKPCSK